MGGTDGRDLRASDDERDQAVRRLRDAVVEGRLTLEEFSERLGRALETFRRADLELLVADLPAASAPPVASGQGADRRAIFSEVRQRGPWRVPPCSAVRCVFGTVELDLREATLSGEETELDVYNLFGTVTVIVALGINVEVEGGGMFSSQKLDTQALSVVVDAPRLLIRTNGLGGTLHVRNSPQPSGVRALLERLGQAREAPR